MLRFRGDSKNNHNMTLIVNMLYIVNEIRLYEIIILYNH